MKAILPFIIIAASGISATAEDFSITLPADAELSIGTKSAHFIDFKEDSRQAI